MTARNISQAKALGGGQHLIHIGFPKCASTFLQEWFAAHPQVAYKPGGLAGMYSIYDLIQSVIDEPGPERCRVTSAEQISVPGDPAHFGSLDLEDIGLHATRMENLCRILAELYPAASILMVTRNRADLVASGFSQLVKQGGHIRDTDYATFAAEASHDLRAMDYDLVLGLYRKHFEGRVLAIPFELLVDDRHGFVAAIADFMGVDHFDIGAGRVNEALDDEQLYWYPRIARLLQLAPSGWLRRNLIALHCRMIRVGVWRPVLILLRLLTGPKASPGKLSPEILRKLEINCEELLRSELYAPYRDLYRGSGGIGAGS